MLVAKGLPLIVRKTKITGEINLNLEIDFPVDLPTAVDGLDERIELHLLGSQDGRLSGVKQTNVCDFLNF